MNPGRHLFAPPESEGRSARRLGRYLWAIRTTPAWGGNRWDIYNRSGQCIGEVQWYPDWKQAVFAPRMGVVLSHGCMLSLAKFCRKFMPMGPCPGWASPNLQCTRPNGHPGGCDLRPAPEPRRNCACGRAIFEADVYECARCAKRYRCPGCYALCKGEPEGGTDTAPSYCLCVCGHCFDAEERLLVTGAGSDPLPRKEREHEDANDSTG